jgi:hypothetical protein
MNNPCHLDRLQAVKAYQAQLAGGLKPADAARAVGRPHTTLWRWHKAWAAGGETALQSRTCRCGRRAAIMLTAAETAALRNHVLAKDSLRLGIEDWFHAEPSEMEPATRAAVQAMFDKAARTRKPVCFPMWLRRAGHLSPEMKAKLRGPKHFLDVQQCDRRGLFYLDEEGRRVDLRPNTIWESDDMSLNQPFVFADPDTGELQSGRQTLCTLDVYSAAWLGITPIGRSRDAYRVTDIADHLWALVQQHGLPEIWRIERGVWENSFIFGIEIAPDVLWGGLDGVMRLDPGFTSRHKGLIESSFNHLQNLLAHSSRDIGRYAGEFERDSTAYGRGDTRGWWEIKDAADGAAAAMRRFNGEAKHRRHFAAAVVPEELYATATKRECPADEAWRFLPVKRAATVRQGAVEVNVNHYPLPFRFRVNGVDDALYLEHGYRVLIAFHPSRPHEGCWIFNGEAGAKNTHHFKLGQKLLLAPQAEDAPQVCYLPKQTTRPRRSQNYRPNISRATRCWKYGSRRARAACGWATSAAATATKSKCCCHAAPDTKSLPSKNAAILITFAWRYCHE